MREPTVRGGSDRHSTDLMLAYQAGTLSGLAANAADLASGRSRTVSSSRCQRTRCTLPAEAQAAPVGRDGAGHQPRRESTRAESCALDGGRNGPSTKDGGSPGVASDQSRIVSSGISSPGSRRSCGYPRPPADGPGHAPGAAWVSSTPKPATRAARSEGRSRSRLGRGGEDRRGATGDAWVEWRASSSRPRRRGPPRRRCLRRIRYDATKQRH